MENMTISEIQEKVISVVSECLDVEKSKISLDSDLVNDLDADSLSQVELVMALEEHFNCEIPEEDSKNILKIKDIVEYVQKKLS